MRSAPPTLAAIGALITATETAVKASVLGHVQVDRELDQGPYTALAGNSIKCAIPLAATQLRMEACTTAYGLATIYATPEASDTSSQGPVSSNLQCVGAPFDLSLWNVNAPKMADRMRFFNPGGTDAYVWPHWTCKGKRTGQLRRILFIGDSLIVDGNNANFQPPWVDVDWGAHLAGMGWSGATVATVTTNATLPLTKQWDAVVVLAGVNDIIGGAASAAIIADLTALYAAIAATGAVVYPVCLTPWNGHVSYNAAKTTAVNAAILAAYPTTAVVTTSLGDGAGALLPANDQGDHLHLSAPAGNQALAALITAKLRATDT